MEREYPNRSSLKPSGTATPRFWTSHCVRARDRRWRERVDHQPRHPRAVARRHCRICRVVLVRIGRGTDGPAVLTRGCTELGAASRRSSVSRPFVVLPDGCPEPGRPGRSYSADTSPAAKASAVRARELRPNRRCARCGHECEPSLSLFDLPGRSFVELSRRPYVMLPQHAQGSTYRALGLDAGPVMNVDVSPSNVSSQGQRPAGRGLQLITQPGRAGRIRWHSPARFPRLTRARPPHRPSMRTPRYTKYARSVRR
jgi:hypothetical protein